MATVTITITPAAGQPATATITLSGADATTIFQAYQAVRPGATLANLAQFLAQQLIRDAQRLVQSNVVIPPPPTMTSDGVP